MKTVRNVLVFIALCFVASAQPNSTPTAEQHFFNLEDSVQNQVDLSDAELGALANDDLMKKLRPDPSAPKLTQDGIEAAVVHLCGSGERDLVVVGDGDAYVTANAGPFWIIRDLPAGPMVVLSQTTMGLTIETKRTKQCLNVETFTATADVGTSTDFSFNGEKYVATKQKSQKLAK